METINKQESKMAVLEALRKSSKGQLKYSRELSNTKRAIQNNIENSRISYMMPTICPPKVESHKVPEPPPIQKSPKKRPPKQKEVHILDLKEKRELEELAKIKRYHENKGFERTLYIISPEKAEVDEINKRKIEEFARFNEKNNMHKKHQLELIHKRRDLELQKLKKELEFTFHISMSDIEERMRAEEEEEMKKIAVKPMEELMAKKREAENDRKRALQQESLILEINKIQQQLNTISYEATNSTMGLKPEYKSQDLIAKPLQNLDNLIEQSEALNQNVNEVSQDSLNQAIQLLSVANSQRQAIATALGIVKQMELEALQVAKEQEAKRQLEAKLKQEQGPFVVDPECPTKPIAIFPHCKELYEGLIQKLEQFNQDTRQYLEDPSLQKFRIMLAKVTVYSVNSITLQNLNEKLAKFYSLLDGRRIIPRKNDSVSIRDHEGGTAMCYHFLAKSLLDQGHTQIKSQPRYAIPIAQVVVELWKHSPELGDIILANFYDKCPYLVPYYPEIQKGKSLVDLFENKKIHLEEGQENDEGVLTYFEGLTSLYAAIIQIPNANNPFGFGRGWAWLAAIMNMAPRPGITSTVLHSFLLVAGYGLQKFYGAPFNNLVRFMYYEYLPHIKKVDLENRHEASYSRLASFLTNVIATGSLPNVLDMES